MKQTAKTPPACCFAGRRKRIDELMGQLRDFEQMVPGESVQKLVTENTSLKHRVRQLTEEHRTLQEPLEGARSNNRFAEKRIADLEAQLVELQQPGPTRPQDHRLTGASYQRPETPRSHRACWRTRNASSGK
ncbi:hypothetical protein [Streptomyces sp. NPDC058701]|uniref:hypothetical protein n=1 Tax=Streptomyces sp. NPDC058701 TaxID=3346608 RepID=UPI0036596C1E